MTWGKLLQPDLVLDGPILDLTPELVQKHDLGGLVLDVDETLVPIYTNEISDELRHCIDRLRDVATLWLVSNNLSETRISTIAAALNLPYLISAAKPSRRKLQQAVDAMNLPPNRIGMVGDRLFTDVLGGNRLGMFTILVEPMVDPGLAVRYYPIRTLEVWFSQVLGASLTPRE